VDCDGAASCKKATTTRRAPEPRPEPRPTPGPGTCVRYPRGMIGTTLDQASGTWCRRRWAARHTWATPTSGSGSMPIATTPTPTTARRGATPTHASCTIRAAESRPPPSKATSKTMVGLGWFESASLEPVSDQSADTPDHARPYSESLGALPGANIYTHTHTHPHTHTHTHTHPGARARIEAARALQ